MSLTSIPFKFQYRSNHDQLYEDFYEPCLQNSVAYDRAAGYFSSHSLRLIARGLEVFLFQEGKIRIIANPVLSKEDIEAIEKGYKAKQQVIERALLKQVDLTATTIKDDPLNVLAWLIYEDQLDIKIAYTNNHSLYHEKFGIFTDQLGNKVAFSGSANETYSGLANNFEKIDVYFGKRDAERIEAAAKDFEALWNNETNGLTVIDIPQSVKQKLLQHRGEKPSLGKTKTNKGITPRPYQRKALDRLKQNNWQGILEMATGTGKTITSLFAAKAYKQEKGRLFLIIYVPFTHLIKQWEVECKKLGFNELTLCYGSRQSWLNTLAEEVLNFNIGITDVHVAITTYKTAATAHFQENVKKIQQHSFLIADECHYLGSRTFRKQTFDHYEARIGLSATPDRWWDEAGTNFLKGVFDRVVYEYSLDEAIAQRKLTPYTYNPQVVSLTEEEMECYRKITRQLIRLYHQEDADIKRIEYLNRKRSLILARAEAKIPALIDLFKEKGPDKISHTLVYCAVKQVNVLTKLLSDLGLRVHKFDSTVPNDERKLILDAFAKGKIQVLVAIKCLDEGVDVPSTRTAYFLASTSNPREFVQRRGRILRIAKGKTMAEIYDFIVLPDAVDTDTFTMIARKELPRFAEFSSSAINRASAKRTLTPYLAKHYLTYLMDKKPWDVYNEMKEAFEDGVFESTFNE